MSGELPKVVRLPRTFFLGRKKEVKTVYTARDYAQNGLVAMWDGIENAGVGVHSNSATYWTDLVRPDNSVRFNLVSSDSWADTGLAIRDSRIVGSGYDTFYFYDYGQPVTPDGWHFELVVSVDSVKQAGGLVLNWRGNINGPFVISTAWNYLRFTGGGNGNYSNDDLSYSIADSIGKAFEASFSLNYGDSNLYCNGVLARTKFEKQAGNSLAHAFTIGSGGQDMVIKSIRVYNRTLTPSEVMSNYEVDAARFGLPKPWKNPYVTDGLIAMWDGEWNAGGGVHNNAGGMVDISGNGHDLLFKDWTKHELGANYVVFSNVSNSYATVVSPKELQDAVESESITVEGVTWNDTGNTGQILTFQKSYSSVQFIFMPRSYSEQRTGFFHYVGSTGSNVSFLPGDTPNAIYSHSLVYDKGIAYATMNLDYRYEKKDIPQFVVSGGYAVTVGARADTDAGRFAGKLYNLRVYNRALTTAEIAHNYAVDKRRFGL